MRQNEIQFKGFMSMFGSVEVSKILNGLGFRLPNQTEPN